MKIRPIRDQVLIQREEAESITKGGIVLPDISKDRPCRGTVLDVGPGKPYDNISDMDESSERVPMNVKIGDRVFYQRYAGNVIDEEQNLLLIRENEIMAIIEE